MTREPDGCCGCDVGARETGCRESTESSVDTGLERKGGGVTLAFNRKATTRASVAHVSRRPAQKVAHADHTVNARSGFGDGTTGHFFGGRAASTAQ